MAWVSCTVKIYNAQSLLITTSATMTNTKTIWNLLSDSNLVSAWVTEISATIWWAALSHSETISSALTVESSSWDIVYMAYIYSPAETITGFYLDWTEYKFEWWWWTADWISTSQPSNPVAGSTYYDTTNKVVKVYNWTSWEEVGWGNVIAMTQAQYDALPEAAKNDGKLRIITDAPEIEIKAWVTSVNWQTWDVTIQTGGNYTAGTWIEITNDEIWLDGTYEWTYTDYSAMQWPAPDGFHVPLKSEWEWLKTIMNWLGLTRWGSWISYLHMPFAGIRWSSNAAIGNQGSKSYYLSSSPHSNSARYLFLSSSEVYTTYYDRANGFSVRCFKNSFELPTSSWTVIKWTLWSAWIFWDTVNWLISITGDGTTWYTIQDKNLWATTVYSDWNTLSEANCGKYYQWGNNYGFAWTWSVTTSSTQVNAQNYWPWNYYSSSTFITWNSDWSSVQNDNLRWWEIWIQTSSGSWSLVVWDKLYKIVTSTTAPANWTASNIITIVTD